jgi:hypothetical protein
VWRPPVGRCSPVELLAQFGRVTAAVPVVCHPFGLSTKGAAMRIVGVTGGVDTHADVHVAAAIDHNGGLLGVEGFPADEVGYADLLDWLVGFGPVIRVGVEGTGSWGVGLTRFLTEACLDVVEVDRPNRQIRRKQGKSDPTDAISAARAALSGTASVIPKGRSGRVEEMRVLLVANRHVSNGSNLSTSCGIWCSQLPNQSGSDSRTVTRPDWSPRQQTCDPVWVLTRSCSPPTR